MKQSKRSSILKISQAYESALLRYSSQIGKGPIIFAVSGGPDSLAMLSGATFKKQNSHPKIIVANFAHGFDKKMDQDANKLLRSICESLDLQFVQGSADVPAIAKKSKLSVETAARRARHEFFATVARENDASCVAVAHTLDDQAETVLFRLIRGTGIRGAGGMREWTSLKVSSRLLHILRPLISVSRSETINACKEVEIIPIEDQMNSNLEFARSRIRHTVLPELIRINSSAVFALSRFANLSSEAHEALRANAITAQSGKERRFPGRVVWNKPYLWGINPAFTGFIFQSAWEYLNDPSSTLSRHHIVKMSALIASPKGGVMHLPKGLTFKVEQDSVSLLSEKLSNTPRALNDLAVPLATPGISNIGLWVFEAKMYRYEKTQTLEFDNPFTALLDANSVRYPAVLRRRKTGDKMVPLGMRAEVRVKDVFAKNKIKRSLRDALPILDTRNGIAWITGVRIADWARVREDTVKILQITARRSDWQPLDDFFI